MRSVDWPACVGTLWATAVLLVLLQHVVGVGASAPVATCCLFRRSHGALPVRPDTSRLLGTAREPREAAVDRRMNNACHALTALAR